MDGNDDQHAQVVAADNLFIRLFAWRQVRREVQPDTENSHQ